MTCTVTPRRALAPREAQQRIEKLAEGSTDLREEREIVDILERQSPQARGETVRLLDGGGDRHTAAKILKKDIDDPTLRARASRLVDEARPFSCSPGTVVLSDIDDTVVPNRGKSVLPTVFPGARELYAALDEGPSGSDVKGDVHFVTARDGLFVSGVPAVKRAGVEFGSVRHGDVASAIASPFDHNRALADRKVKNLTELVDKNPSRAAVLVGDTVQADPDVFRRVMDARPGKVSVALVHAIPGFKAPAFVQHDARFVVFADYGEAARALCDRGLIDETQRDRVLASVAAAPLSARR
ncbi:MAG: DUF2183 domain-containing protein [Deltaproteobacteria bacterium]|nr:DUF2183 domain-containing protein [Deltaproteobacteria bacterium]